MFLVRYEAAASLTLHLITDFVAQMVALQVSASLTAAVKGEALGFLQADFAGLCTREGNWINPTPPRCSSRMHPGGGNWRCCGRNCLVA